jgi:GNAT superfamily N-acetyltransferase
MSPDDLILRPGTRRDYLALAAHHYRANAPVTASRVLTLVDPTPSIVSRFTGEPDDQPQVVAVLVESYPALSCALRDQALPGRYTGSSDRAAAAKTLNAELRCISRVVVHPQWRGLGLAVRLVRHALDTATTAYTEALAAMGHVHPFFQQAGMTAYHRWPHPREQRLQDAMAACGIEPWRLASRRELEAQLEQLPADRRRLFEHELTRWAGRKLTRDARLTRARDELLANPVYYLKKAQRH